jgi:hypothetical protein
MAAALLVGGPVLFLVWLLWTGAYVAAFIVFSILVVALVLSAARRQR